MSTGLDRIHTEIINDPMNWEFTEKGYVPVYTASEKARIMIVGQAPGRKAQESMTPWNDVSGDALRRWLGVDRETFYNPDIFALVPMDFYYPGKGAHGDKPPRKEFAPKWHPQLLAHMPNIRLIILVGAYSQKYYLGARGKRNLTETVYNYTEYLPQFFPLVHPSPLNFRWRAQHTWFEQSIIPALHDIVHDILNKEKIQTSTNE